MNASDYLRDLLASQEMPEGCAELEALDDARDEVERLVREAYPDSNISFTHGGSRAKGTLVNVDYDLDLPLYIECEDTAVGETLEDIYENIAALLERKFAVRHSVGTWLENSVNKSGCAPLKPKIAWLGSPISATFDPAEASR